MLAAVKIIMQVLAAVLDSLFALLQHTQKMMCQTGKWLQGCK